MRPPPPDGGLTTQSPQPASYVAGNFQQSIASGAGYVIGVGDASPWLVGTDSNGYHYTNDPPNTPRTWREEPNDIENCTAPAVSHSSAGTTSLAVSPEGVPWTIDGSGHIWKHAGLPPYDTNDCWIEQGPTFAAWEIGVGRYSSTYGDNVAFAVNRNVFTHAHNYRVDSWNGSSWVVGSLYARHVAVAPDGTAYASDASGTLYKFNGSSWQSWGSGCVHNYGTGDHLGWPTIGAGPLDSVWVLGCTGNSWGQQIYAWTPLTNSWNQVTGNATALSVGADGTPWVVSSSNLVYEYVSTWQQIGPRTGFGFQHTIGPVDPGSVQFECADHTGEILTEEYSGEVHDIDATNTAGQSGHLAIGSTSGGAWVTPTPIFTWSPLNDIGAGINAQKGPNMSTGTIAAKPGLPSTVIVGTGVAELTLNNGTNGIGNGIWRTTNALDPVPAWTKATCATTLGGIIPCPSPVVKIRYTADGTTIYAAGPTSLFYSTDGGATFIQSPMNCNPTGDDFFSDMVVDPNDDTAIYLGVGNSKPTNGFEGEGVDQITQANTSSPICSSSHVLPTLSGGSTVITSIALAMTSSSVVYAAVAGLSCPPGTPPLTCSGVDSTDPTATDRDFQGIFSTNSTLHPWLQWGTLAHSTGQQPFTGSQFDHNWALGTNPTGSVILLGGVGIWRGTGCDDQQNGCSTFCWETDIPHGDQHAIVWGTDGVVYDANDGGIFYSTDDGVTWRQDIDSIGVSNEVSVSVGPTVFYGADWDVGAHYSTDNGATWLGDSLVSGVDGHQVLVDPGNQSNAFYCQDIASNSANGARRFANVGGGGWAEIDTNDVNGTSEPCSMAKAASGNLFTVFQTGVFQSSNYGQTWSSYSSLLPGGPTGVLATNDYPNPTVYVTIPNSSNLFWTSSSTQSFQATAVPTDWPTGDVILGNSAALDRSSGDIYIVGAGNGAPAVYMAPASSKGASATAWIKLTGTAGYSNEALNQIAVDSSTRSTILVNEGQAGNSVYRLSNPDVRDSPTPTHHWRPWVYGLPTGAQPVKAVTGQYENGVFYYYVATWGRGIWKREARGGDY